MNRPKFPYLIATLVLLMALIPASAIAAPTFQDDPQQGANTDDPPHPLGDEQRALHAQAVQALALGKAHGNVVEVARGQFVELGREDEDLIWTVIGEFGDLSHPAYPGGLPGPLHNQIPEPDRTVDNTTIWAPDFNQAYYENLLFSEAPGAVSMRNYYIEQSSNRYTVDGDVTDWVQVPYNQARYGRNYCGGIVCATTWLFVRDSLNAWYADQVAAGMSAGDINAYLSQFDVWDRYDYDGDGNFDEPDGYIDHFQSVHAGEGEETGGGAYGSDAIWSHRWYAFFNLIGTAGPSFNKLGGLQVGTSDFWVGDYTIEPENGGVGVFAHEFGHDLGLPDLYDTSGNTCGSTCENSTGFWTIMSSGSYGSTGVPADGIGSKPVDMGVWEKFQLGWLKYEVASAGAFSVHKLGPAESTTKQAQGLFVVLPDKEVIDQIATPFAGAHFYYSGAGDNLDNIMYREFNLGAGSSLNAMVQFDIELDWDYAYLVASSDGGATWTNVHTNLSTNTSPNGQNFGEGITGTTGGNWVALSADLSAFTGPTLLGFRYWTDGFVAPVGFMVDEINVSGFPTDGAESDAGWTFDGFKVTDGVEVSFHFNAYVVEFRQYRGYDKGLQTGPYNFGFLDDPALGNWVEHFPYQDGLLISYWDNSQSDNNTSSHPGEGLILPIDAHPSVMYRADGQPWRSRIQSYDSTFTLAPTDGITLHFNSQPSVHPSQPGVSVFNDTIQYWNPLTPAAGVMNPNTGTMITIRSFSSQGNFMQVEVKPAP